MATVTTQERTNILKLVAGMFNAAPGATYLNEFTDAFVALNKDLGALANALGQTGAFKSLYPSFLSAEEFANKFLDTLGLKANTEAQDWVKAKVTAGESYASVIFQALVAIDASTAAEFKAAKDQLTNKTTVAEYYSVEQNKSATDLAALQAVVAKVTNDAATVEAAKAGAAATAGKEFSLTNAVGENVVGTAGNDTFKAVLGDATGLVATSTLNIGDVINGGAGTDTLELILAGAAAGVLPAGASISNVEKVFLTHTDNAASISTTAMANSASYAGIKELWQVDNDTTAAGTFGNVVAAADVTAGFKSTGANATAAAAAVTVTAASNAQTVLSAALDGVSGTGSSLTFVGTGVKTINVAGSVAAPAAGNGAGNLTVVGTATAETLKLSLTSAVDLTLTTFAAGLKTIDASATTGAIRADGTLGSAVITTTANLETVKLGSAGDSVNFNLSAATKALTIDAGAGNDRITLDGTIADDKGDVSVTLGAGKDVLVIANTLQTLGAGVTTVAELTERMIKVTDFKTAEDVLDLSAAGGVALTSEQLATVAGSANLLAAVTAVDAIVGTGSAVFSFGGDAYVFSSNAAGLAANDALVQLVGVDATQFTNIQNGNLVL